ncbi:hypothetical protein ACFSKU_18985 [Pontibacter silvestris]|uniref:Uncharacterized protein n=1 Tax=Pontibacter silvestris TaxID=2305183 RepID=A0ABW4X4G7_9BACT|nr:hypothetical protein [Pontibacter silvestris]MCC9135022.1 hypothetical protein [Pontibacter silvestris]
MENREEDKNKKIEPTSTKTNNDDYNERMSMGNTPDPSAKRNIGPGGEQERAGQKDKLENLHIGGNETTGYGDNDHSSVESFAQGPGYEYEGSDTAMDDSVSGIRRGDQPLGEDEEKSSDADFSRR